MKCLKKINTCEKAKAAILETEAFYAMVNRFKLENPNLDVSELLDFVSSFYNTEHLLDIVKEHHKLDPDFFVEVFSTIYAKNTGDITNFNYLNSDKARFVEELMSQIN